MFVARHSLSRRSISQYTGDFHLVIVTYDSSPGLERSMFFVVQLPNDDETRGERLSEDPVAGAQLS